MKNEVIIAAVDIGFFRTKDDEKKNNLLVKLCATLEYHDNKIIDILETETKRRHEVYKARQLRALQKQDTEDAKPVSGGVMHAGEHVQHIDAGRYVLTCAQNNTDVHKHFLQCIKQYCDFNGATLMVAPITYNKTGFSQPGQDVTDGIYYDPLIVPYLVNGHIRMGGAIDFIAGANVIPTSKNPLQGFEAVTPAGFSAVIPASTIALKCIAGLKGAAFKALHATGAVTVRNYILRKAGAVASTAHNHGALFVDTTVHPPIVRQLEMVDNATGFYDLDRFYDGDNIIEASPTCIQFGDIHAEQLTDENKDKIVNIMMKYGPAHVMLHDVSDFSSRNHHNRKDPLFMYKQHVLGNTVKDDLQCVANIIDIVAQYTGMVHIVESNHDLALLRWIKEADPKEDPINALVYYKCMLALCENIENPDFNLMQYAYENISEGNSINVTFHKTDESIKLCGVEHGVHGHSGVNGARGSPTSFRVCGVKMNTGHTHTPGIVGGVYTAGVSAGLDLGYNVGPSSWALANIFTYENGQRQIIFM